MTVLLTFYYLGNCDILGNEIFEMLLTWLLVCFFHVSTFFMTWIFFQDLMIQLGLFESVIPLEFKLPKVANLLIIITFTK